jgi:16S rRNA processing protein RimM
LLEVGRIARAHGIRGEVVVSLTTDRLERVARGSVLTGPDGRAYEVVASRPHQGHHIVAFAGVPDRNAAEALRGTVLHAEAIDDPGAVWVHDVVGATVVDLAGTAHGEVVALEANPASDLLVLDSGALVPLTFLVDRRAGDPPTLVVDPPDGLFEG